MIEKGSLDSVNIVDLQFVDGGQSLRIELRDSIAPFKTSRVLSQGIHALALSRFPGDEFPFFVPEMSWFTLVQDQLSDELTRLNYELIDDMNLPLVHGRDLVMLQFEGSICGKIISDSLRYELTEEFP